MINRDPRRWLTNGHIWTLLKSRARGFRGAPTEAEARLWGELRKFGPQGIRFRRQHVIESFIVDFFSWRHRLVIEVDGRIHDSRREQDAARDRRLASKGIRVIRFSNEDVIHSMDAVLERIRYEIETSRSPNRPG